MTKKELKRFNKLLVKSKKEGWNNLTLTEKDIIINGFDILYKKYKNKELIFKVCYNGKVIAEGNFQEDVFIMAKQKLKLNYYKNISKIEMMEMHEHWQKSLYLQFDIV